MALIHHRLVYSSCTRLYLAESPRFM
jgi:hypothetical protein